MKCKRDPDGRKLDHQSLQTMRMQSVAAVKRVGARIFFADEAGMRSDHHAGTTWAPMARTPAVPTTRVLTSTCSRR